MKLKSDSKATLLGRYQSQGSYSYLFWAAFKSSCKTAEQTFFICSFPNRPSRLTLSAEEGNENIQRYSDNDLGTLSGNHISCLC